MVVGLATARGDCGQMRADWDKLAKFGDVWKTPVTLAYRQDVDFVINGSDIFPEINMAIGAYDSASFYDFGARLGEASNKIFNGMERYKNRKEHPDPKVTPIPDAKIQYAKKMGAEFAAGFLYGAQVGGFDEGKLFDCLDREITADQIFVQADADLKTAIQNNDPNMAV